MYSEEQYRADLERYRREHEAALEQFGEEHPLTKTWARRARTVERFLGRFHPAPTEEV
jgi:hypothetical protein